MKPDVFISHSSRDSEIANRLKTLLVSKTSGTINFFLSSDGNSIKSGRNWFNESISALSKASLIYILVSPNSLQSQWIFFEAGFAYKSDIQCIPLGILGVNVGELPLPLGILQGYNLDSVKGLNKVIEDLNYCLSYDYPLAFSKIDFGFFEKDVFEFPQVISNGFHEFRVYSVAPDEEIPHEFIEVQVEFPEMTIRGDKWVGTGLLTGNRYVGRFKYHRGDSPYDVGAHDFVWNGKEFSGSAKIDSGRWDSDGLLWRRVKS